MLPDRWFGMNSVLGASRAPESPSASRIRPARRHRLTICRATAAVFAIAAGGAAAQTPGPGPMPGAEVRALSVGTARAGDPQHGRIVVQAHCAACHGVDGNAPAPQTPKLAGQYPAYLYRRVQAFKTGRLHSAIMGPIAAALSDADIADAASYYAGQLLRPDPLQASASLAEGRRLDLSGISGSVPACAACHASGSTGGPQMRRPGRMPMGRGMMGGRGMRRGAGAGAAASVIVPRIGGQHAAYLINQLDRFASGERPYPLMGRIAAALSASQRRAVAAYLSSRP